MPFEQNGTPLADVQITLLRGMNNTDPPLSLPEDQGVSAINVEWTVARIAERRRGSAAIDVSGSDLVGHDRIPFLHRHLPVTDEAGSELWALGVTGTSSSDLCRKTTTWSTVTPVDAITLTNGAQYQVTGQTLHGKLFLAYKSAVDRLHVWDGTSLRRVGFGQPAAPTGADSGVAGSLAGTRYYRVREVALSGTTVLRRSEPSETLTFAPDGAHASITVTKPADLGEGATHWELEASLDLNGDYYRIARTVVATTTVVDSVAYGTGYASTGDLAEDVGDYYPMPSVKYLLVDEDRLIGFGSFEDDTMASRMVWTPVYTDTGSGNDERITLDPTSELHLDTYEGGGITGAVGPVNGELWIFKWSHVYKGVRTGVRANAYDVMAISKVLGAIPGSMVEAVDQFGSPCVYFLDPRIGPCRIGADGTIKQCGRDIFTTWQTVNLDAASVGARVIFYRAANQIHWWVPTDDADVPTLRLVLHVKLCRDTPDGVRNGWALWDGPSAGAIAVCRYADNVDVAADRSLLLVPLIGLATGATIYQTDTGTDDAGTSYVARAETRPYAPNTIMHRFGVTTGSVLGEAVSGASVDLSIIRDFGVETLTCAGLDFSPNGQETQVMAAVDQLAMSEARTVACAIADAAGGVSARWVINQIALQQQPEQMA